MHPHTQTYTILSVRHSPSAYYISILVCTNYTDSERQYVFLGQTFKQAVEQELRVAIDAQGATCYIGRL